MRASGVRPCSFSARSLTTSTALAPSQIWLALAAEMTPPSCSSLTEWMPSSVASKRMPSSISVQAVALGRLDLQPDDLVAEVAALGRGGGAAVAFERIFVELLAGEAVFLGDHLRAHELAELDAGVALFLPRRLGLAEPGLREQHAGRAHRHARHALDARRDHHVLRARHHRLRRELDRLLRRAALAVDRHGGHALGQLRRQHRAAADLEALLAALADAAHDDVLDRRRVDAGAVDDRVEHLARHVGRVPARQLAAALAARGADRFDDIGFRHHPSPYQVRYSQPLLPQSGGAARERRAMHGVSEAVAARRSVRGFLDTPVEPARAARDRDRGGARGDRRQSAAVACRSRPRRRRWRELKAIMAAKLAAGETETPAYDDLSARARRRRIATRRFGVGEAMYGRDRHPARGQGARGWRGSRATSSSSARRRRCS